MRKTTNYQTVKDNKTLWKNIEQQKYFPRMAYGGF